MANDDPQMSPPQMSPVEIERLFSQAKESGAAASTASGSSKSEGLPAVQDDIEKLLSEAGRSGPAAASATATATPVRSTPAATSSPSSQADIASQDIEYLLAQAEKALESVNSNNLGDVPSGVTSYRLEEFRPAAPSTEAATLDLVRDVDLDLKIELGRTNMYLEDVLKLRKGSVVPLDKLAGDPVDIYVNGRLIARGEVLVLNDNFCVRVAELIVGANAVA